MMLIFHHDMTCKGRAQYEIQDIL